MPLSITVDITGTPEGNDVEAAVFAVENYNSRTESDLPTSPLGALATSYETVQTALLERAHASYAQQASDAELKNTATELWRAASEAQRAAAITALGG